MVFVFNDTATTEIYTLSLHDALPILAAREGLLAEFMRLHRRMLAIVRADAVCRRLMTAPGVGALVSITFRRSEEHTSELQSRQYLVCRLLLEKKKITDRRAADTNTTT